MKLVKVARFVLPMAAVLLVLISACKKPGDTVKSSISGKVTYKGTPVAGGKMVFHSMGGESAYFINADGSYYQENLMEGPTKVTVETESVRAADNPNVIQIPKKYSDVKTTPLSVDITKGKQTKDFDLTD